MNKPRTADRRANVKGRGPSAGGGRTQEKPRIALVLQGGGALGAYHIGAYQALEEAGYRPNWVSGISIGAINAAIIAGNRPEDRLKKLEQLWDAISWPNEWGSLLSGQFRVAFNEMSAAGAMLFGQPNFWRPRFPSPMLIPQLLPEEASFCDTSPIRETLQRLAQFDLINSRAVRISLGATRLSTGDLQFFDNWQDEIRVDHVLASGSLPPGFPATRVGDELYWDGGCVSNTPLEAIYADDDTGHTLVFLIDLWGAAGVPPTSMDQVSWRQKQIQYASRTSHAIAALATQHNLRRALRLAGKKLPNRALDNSAVSNSAAMKIDKTLDIVHVIYHPSSDQVSESDAEFSRPSIASRRAAGYADLRLALTEAPWTKYRKAEHTGTVVHRVECDSVTSHECH